MNTIRLGGGNLQKKAVPPRRTLQRFYTAHLSLFVFPSCRFVGRFFFTDFHDD